jgi:hypothetical protein
MNPDNEKLFFEHDIATPLTNLHGAHYLLKLYLKEREPEVEESLRILEANIRNIERMMGWYWRIRDLDAALQPVTPWEAGDLPRRLAMRVGDEALPVSPPEESVLHGRIAIPQDVLDVGLLGAALTLRSAAGSAPRWTFDSADAFCCARYELEGDEDFLDPVRLFRKVFWPSGVPVAAWVDAGLPYLQCVLEGFGGTLELTWKANTWSLEATIPTVR